MQGVRIFAINSNNIKMVTISTSIFFTFSSFGLTIPASALIRDNSSSSASKALPQYNI